MPGLVQLLGRPPRGSEILQSPPFLQLLLEGADVDDALTVTSLGVGCKLLESFDGDT